MTMTSAYPVRFSACLQAQIDRERKKRREHNGDRHACKAGIGEEIFNAVTVSPFGRFGPYDHSRSLDPSCIVTSILISFPLFPIIIPDQNSYDLYHDRPLRLRGSDEIKT